MADAHSRTNDLQARGADDGSAAPAERAAPAVQADGPLRQAMGELAFETRGQGFREITAEIADWLSGQALSDGLLTVYIRHTSASLVIQENVDADVQADMLDFFRQLVPEDTSLYRHIAEGSDDQPAHIRAAMTQTHLAIPVQRGRMLLGRYQGVFLFEHRESPKTRHIALHLMGT
jgi:secondary thiamine-phosphate synthase enzyme